MSHYPQDTSASGQQSDLFQNIWLISSFPNFNSAAEWMNNFILYFTGHVIT